jgi:hypothetical protein
MFTSSVTPSSHSSGVLMKSYKSSQFFITLCNEKVSEIVGFTAKTKSSVKIGFVYPRISDRRCWIETINAG